MRLFFKGFYKILRVLLLKANYINCLKKDMRHHRHTLIRFFEQTKNAFLQNRKPKILPLSDKYKPKHKIFFWGKKK